MKKSQTANICGLKRLKHLTALLLTLSAFSLSLHAQDWNGSVSNDWFNGANWNGGSVPTASNAVYINGGTAVISTAGATSMLTNIYGIYDPAATLHITGNGSLTTYEPTRRVSEMLLGSLIIDGNGSWTTSNGVRLSLQGVMLITDNGRLTSNGLSAVVSKTITISGNGSLNTNALDSSSELILLENGSVNVASGCNFTMSYGKLVVQDSGSVTVGGNFNITGANAATTLAITGTAPKITVGGAATLTGTLNLSFETNSTLRASEAIAPHTFLRANGGITGYFSATNITASSEDYLTLLAANQNGNDYNLISDLSWNQGLHGTFTVSGSNTFIVDTVLSDTSAVNSLVKNGDGTLIFESVAAYTGSTVINSGALIYNTAANYTANNLTVSGSGVLVQQGSGTLTLGANGAYNGTVINHSNLSLGGVDQTIHTLINNGNVHFINLGKTLTLTNLGGSGVFHMDTDLVAGTSDFINVTGSATGNHTLKLTNSGADPDGQSFRVEVARIAAGDATFSGTVSVGMFNATVQQDGNVWYLENIINSGSTPPASEVGKDLLADQPSQSQSWFDNNNIISTHLGDLRVSQKSPSSLKSLTGGILDAVWIKSHGQQVNVSGKVVGAAFREYQYGVDAGADHRWTLDKNNTLILGGFIGYGTLDRTLRNGLQNEGSTDNYHFGAYGIWLHDSGLYADFIAKAQHADHEISAWDASHNHTTADYDNWAGGITFDLGKKFTFKDGWYAEPSLSAGYTHFTGENYTANSPSPFTVSISDADVFQFKLGIQFGRTITLSGGGILQPYVKVTGVEQLSTGGKLKASGAEWRPTLDGASAEIGGGIIWQLNADHQLTLDYEASFGGKYDKPWGLTAGYRYQF